MVELTLMAVWRSASMGYGAQCVTTVGAAMMQWLSAVSLDFLSKAIKIHAAYYYDISLKHTLVCQIELILSPHIYPL